MNADILFFFNDHMDALPLYERLEELILEQIPDAKIKVSKTQISFFTSVALPSCLLTPAAGPRNVPMSG